MKSILNYTKKKRSYAQRFQKFSLYLVPGDYTFDDTLNYIRLKDREVEAFGRRALDTGYRVLRDRTYTALPKKVMNALLRPAFSARLKVRRIPSEFSGQIFLPSGDDTRGKIFDIKQKRILNYFESAQDKAETLERLDYFSRFFRTPDVFEATPDAPYYTEALIEGKPRGDWTLHDLEAAVHDWLGDHIAMCEATRDEAVVTEQPVALSAVLPRIAEAVLKEPFPSVYSHGDLWTSNLLLADALYVIDWDRAGMYPFFYDFFVFLMNESLNLNDRHLMHVYEKGAFDGELQALFGVYDLPYLPDYRRDYLVYSLGVYLDTRGITDPAGVRRIREKTLEH